MASAAPLPKERWVNIMRFYSRIVRQPESIITEVKDGTKVVSRKRVCQFLNGICDTEDPKAIAMLKKHPNRFRTDKPWPANNWQDTKEGIKLLDRGKELGIDVRHIAKPYLLILISEIEKGKGIVGVKKGSSVLEYPELVAKAKELGIATHKKKKEDLIKEIEEKENIEEKEVILNAH